MKKNLAAASAIVALVLLLMTSVYGSSGPNASIPHVVDRANLLTTSEAESLNSLFLSYAEETQVDISVVTVMSITGTVRDYANNMYDQYEYGISERRNGVMLFINMGERDWYIVTNGTGNEIIDDRAIDRIWNQCMPHLQNGDAYSCFKLFAELCRNEILYPGNNSQSNGYEHYEAPKTIRDYFWYILIASVGIALIITSVMRVSMNTARENRYASDYIVKNSFKVTHSNDIYLYSTTSRVKRDSDDDRSSRSSSSSSSSSDRGGHGGKF
ncbi:MAG: TPM domain-containing protein [Eubacteriaceae bacterium]|nr:TPM domain-containing protein [Eubacteriaceae bacterium]